VEHEAPPEPSIPPEIIEHFPPQFREILRQPGASQVVSLTAAAFAASHEGPLPSAQQLREYEGALPGAAERIFAMAERQQEHRMHLEKIAVEGGNQRSWWGLWLGFFISLVVLGLSAGAIYTGHAWEGATGMSVDVVALAAVFVYGRADQRKERVAKDAQTQLSRARPSRQEADSSV